MTFLLLLLLLLLLLNLSPYPSAPSFLAEAAILAPCSYPRYNDPTPVTGARERAR